MLDISLTVAWAVAVAGISWYFFDVVREVTYVTLADGRRQERSLPILFKLLLPYVQNLRRLVSKPFFAAQVEVSDSMLISAGFEGLLNGREFVALKLMVPVIFGSLWCVLVFAAGAFFRADNEPVGMLDIVMCFLGFALTYLFPMLWLRGALKKRHLSIMKALPFVLDLLTLSVEAGMDFISALQRNCTTRKLDPLNEELLRMTKEIQVGVPRREALANMAKRCGQSDLKSVAFSLIQADELGVPIGSILRIQSDQMRSRRFDRAEKLANEAPTKMLGPLMICIFPAVFIILLGPVLAQALKDMM